METDGQWRAYASADGIKACEPYMRPGIDLYFTDSRDVNRMLPRDGKLYIVGRTPPWVHAAPWLHQRLVFI